MWGTCDYVSKNHYGGVWLDYSVCGTHTRHTPVSKTKRRTKMILKTNVEDSVVLTAQNIWFNYGSRNEGWISPRSCLGGQIMSRPTGPRGNK